MKRQAARENAFILLFEAECRDDETALEIFEYAEQVGEFEINDYVKTVFFGANENAQIIEETIAKHSVGWKKDRISPVSMAVLRLAIYEMMFMSDIPGRVSINEAIELSKKYDDEKAYGFVNGVLNAVADKLGRK